MSSDFYFRFWSSTLVRLEKLTKLDVYYQSSRFHDQRRCDAAQRLLGVLAEYQAIYNDLVECDRRNLQIQKIKHIESVIHAVVERINELKQQIRKLEASQHQFFGHGLALHRITTNDVELSEVPKVIERSDFIEDLIEKAFEYVKFKQDEKERAKKKEQDIEEVPVEAGDKWWETEEAGDDTTAEGKFGNVYDIEEKIDEETLKKRELITIIQAHEKTRQVTQWFTQRQERRILWTKELTGERNPEARLDIRIKSARLIEKVLRKYIELKRKRISDFRRDELLGLNYYNLPNKEAEQKNNEIQIRRESLRKKYHTELKTLLDDMTLKYMEKRKADIAEDFRDEIREWFLTWYKQVKTFYDIPNDRIGGTAQIVKEEVPTPKEWWEQYQTYLQQLKSNKNKSTMQQKWEQKQEIKNKLGVKRQDNVKKKLEEAMQKKIMKNPKMHPGFHYPESKKTADILKEIQKYLNDWNDFDSTEASDVKQKFVKSLVNEDAWFDVKMQVREGVNNDMRKELKLLKKALKRDYHSIGEKIPEMKVKRVNKDMRKELKPLKKTVKRDYRRIGDKIKRKKIKKKLNKIRVEPSENLGEAMKELAVKGILKIVPITKITDYIGDHNFAGDDFRCMYMPAIPFAGEIRQLWWDQCRQVGNGCRAVLLVGPDGSGKTTLAHAMASANNACFLELNPSTIAGEYLSSVYLENLIKCVISSAKATQPSVIYIKHVHTLFYKKVPHEDKNTNLDMMKKYLIRTLFKRISKKDNVTIIGTCENPWLTKSRLMLKKFPNVVLVPNTNYTTVVQMLKEWVLSNHTLPKDMDISSLAYMLQGYKFSVLNEALQSFLSADNIIKIASYGLTIEEIYNHILECGDEKPIDYKKYLKWYNERTPWGQKERKQLRSQLEFRALADKLEAKKQKKRRTSRSSKRGSKSSRKSR